MDSIDHPAPCSAWSLHAAELVAPLLGDLQSWPETPTVDRMVAEGYLHRLLPGRFAPPDVLDSALRRALLLGAAIGTELRRHHVIAGDSALWVLLGGPPPSPAEMLTTAHRSPLAGVRVRHAGLNARDVETVGGAPVTSPVRTAMDLLRFGSHEVVEQVRELLEAGHVTEAQVDRALLLLPHQYRVRTARLRLMQAGGGLRPHEAESGSEAETCLPSAVTR